MNEQILYKKLAQLYFDRANSVCDIQHDRKCNELKIKNVLADIGPILDGLLDKHFKTSLIFAAATLAFVDMSKKFN